MIPENPERDEREREREMRERERRESQREKENETILERPLCKMRERRRKEKGRLVGQLAWLWMSTGMTWCTGDMGALGG